MHAACPAGSAREGVLHSGGQVQGRSGADAMQAGGASRVGEAHRLASEPGSRGAPDKLDVLGRVSNYLGSWMGLSPVSEHEGGLAAPHRTCLRTLGLSVALWCMQGSSHMLTG